jgi:hypothetical protein
VFFYVGRILLSIIDFSTQVWSTEYNHLSVDLWLL